MEIYTDSDGLRKLMSKGRRGAANEVATHCQKKVQCTRKPLQPTGVLWRLEGVRDLLGGGNGATVSSLPSSARVRVCC